jgi:hypothetical protein
MSDQPQTHRGILPGMAAIALFLLFTSMFTGFQIMRSGAAAGARYSILLVCTLVLIGVFGFLKLRRWGWSLVTAGCLLGAAANFYAFHRTHMGPYVIQGLFLLLFFLYLSRPEVRERVY